MKTYGTCKHAMAADGAGFSGSHLIDELIDRGDEGDGMDSLFTGAKCNIDHQQNNPCFEFVGHYAILPFGTAVDELYKQVSSPSSYVFQRAHFVTGA